MENKIFNSRAHYLELIHKIYFLAKDKKKINHHWFFIKIITGFFFHSIYGQKANNVQVIYTPTYKRFFKLLLKQPLRLILYIKIRQLEKKLISLLENKTLLIGYKKNNIRGGNYSLYLHPFLEELNGEIFYLDDDSNDKSNIYNYYKLLDRFYALSLFSLNNLISKSDLDFINDLIKNETIIEPLKLNWSLLRRINTRPHKIKQKRRFLRVLNPQTLFCYCYYDDQINDMLYAANELHINTIEYQHSSITNTHFAYAAWEQIDNIHKHFPKEFWVWRDEDATLIKNSFCGEKYIPVVKVVGNRYLETSIKNNSKRNESVTDNILICLQGQWIPNFLEDFIKSDSSHNWYIRLHPRHPQDKPKLDSLILEKKSKLFVKEANERDLYDVLNDVSAVITSFSGTAIEAEGFGKKVIIYGEEGYNSYKEKIENDIYFFVDNFQTLKDVL